MFLYSLRQEYTCFEPPYTLAQELLDMNSKDAVEFEGTLPPELARRGRVYSVVIPSESWIPINTQKGREEFDKKLLALNRRSG